MNSSDSASSNILLAFNDFPSIILPSVSHQLSNHSVHTTLYNHGHRITFVILRLQKSDGLRTWQHWLFTHLGLLLSLTCVSHMVVTTSTCMNRMATQLGGGECVEMCWSGKHNTFEGDVDGFDPWDFIMWPQNCQHNEAEFLRCLVWPRQVLL